MKRRNDPLPRPTGPRWLQSCLAVAVCLVFAVACSDDNDAAGDSQSDVGNQNSSDRGTADATSDSGGTASADVWGASDDAASAGDTDGGGGNTNVSFAGAQDFGYFRALLDANIVPESDDFEASGFFAEHHTPLPDPDCGDRICMQAMLGVLGNLLNGANCTLLQLGLNSPIEADPGQRPPLTLSIVVDVSGSMSGGDRLGFVRDGLEQLVDQLRDEDRVSIVSYSSDVNVVWPMQDVALNRGDLREVIRGLEAGGTTNIYAGLEAGYTQVQNHYDSGRQNRVILLSDGRATAGISGTDSILEMSSLYNSDGIGLTTVGLGTDFNLELMRGLAELGDGNFYFLENAGAVDEVFTEEISYFTVPVAFDLELELEEGSNFVLGAAHGTSMWQRTPSGGRLEIPSVFLAHRVSHDDVTEEGGRRGGGSMLLVEMMPNPNASWEDAAESRVATIHLSFREPGTDRLVEETLHLKVPFGPDFTPPTGFWDSPDVSIIQKSFVVLNIFVGMQMAVDLFHDGRGVEGIEILLRLLAAVDDYNEEVQDVDIDFDVALVMRLIEVMQNNGAVEPPPFDGPEDPWPCD